MMSDKFRVKVATGMWQDQWPSYFDNFVRYCNHGASKNGYMLDTVMNYELKPHGRLIKTKTQGWYLRWDDEKYHTHFVMKWS